MNGQVAQGDEPVPLSREYPERPIVGVGAILIDKNCVLLVQRGKEPLKGEWSIPGGAVELGETLDAALHREVWEETGLEIESRGIVEVLDRIHSEQERVRYHFVLIDYLCRVTGGTLKAASDAADARWIQREELNSHSVYRVAPGTVAVIEKAFQLASSTPA
jgi:8-oxo-dGTP diphosphatase